MMASMKTEFSAEERSAIVEKTGVNAAYLYQCLSGRKDMKPADAVRVEREAGIVGLRLALRRRDGGEIWPELAEQLTRQVGSGETSAAI